MRESKRDCSAKEQIVLGFIDRQPASAKTDIYTVELIGSITWHGNKFIKADDAYGLIDTAGDTAYFDADDIVAVYDRKSSKGK